MHTTLRGIGIPCGVGIGRVHHGDGPELDVVERELDAGAVTAEIARFRKALASAQRELRRIRARVPRRASTDIRSFIDAHLLMMKDRALTEVVFRRIRDESRNAEWVLARQRDALLAEFDRIDDPYLRTRRDDVAQVVDRILTALAGSRVDTDTPAEGVIEVAETLDAASVLRLHQRGAAGFVTETGGPLSHMAIVARSLGMPAIVGVHGARSRITPGMTVVLDSESGTIHLDPDESIVRGFRGRQRKEARTRTGLRLMRDAPAQTRDGRRFTLLANIERPEDLRAVRSVGAEGVGLYRTEFLFLDRIEPPDEEEQLAAYRKVVKGMRGAPVTIRTLDLGADRALPGHPTTGENPALGLRAIRLGLARREWLMPQLCALLRASTTGPLSIMVPMVGGIMEVERFRVALDEARADLERRGLRFAAPVPVGVMVEVPAAALAAPRLAQAVDFLSIGTNDLIQYTLAVDRADDAVNHLYDPLNPAVLKLVSGVLRAGARAGIEVSLCGEMAGDKRYVRLLLGLGLTRFSMHPGHMLEVKHTLATADAEVARRHAARIIGARDPEHARELLDALNSDG